MMRVRQFLGRAFTTAILMISLACTRGEKQPSEVTLRQEWFPNSNYAGALFASREFAKKHNLVLKVVAGSDQIDPVAQVISGHDMFGDASADKVLLANQRGANLVIIGVVSLNSPTVFLSKAEKRIRTPKDFEGRRVGVLSGTNTEYVYRTLVNKLRLDKRRIKEVEAPFDLTSFVVSDAYDVRPAFIYDEPVSLDLKGIRYTLIEPKNYGISFIGTVYFTKRETIEKHRQMVQDFVSAVTDGWRAAIRYQEDAIRLLKEYDKNIDSNRELLSLKKGEPYFRGKAGRILWADTEDWEEMVGALKNLRVLKNDFQVSASLDNSFLQTYYATEGK